LFSLQFGQTHAHGIKLQVRDIGIGAGHVRFFARQLRGSMFRGGRAQQRRRAQRLKFARSSY